MTLWPLIERELRSSARQKFTYSLRLLGAGSLVVAAIVFAFHSGMGQSLGGKLFGALHQTLFAAIWIFVPFLTADCISRERREGTLALLFLTRLRAREIVLAKSFVHGLRAGTLWLAVTPVLTVPFLLGGVGWREALVSVAVNLGSICLALATGLLGSALCRHWTRTLVWVTFLGLFLCGAFTLGHFLVVVERLGFLGRLGPTTAARLLEESIGLATDSSGGWSLLLSRISRAQTTRWLCGEALTACGCVAFLWLAVSLVAWQVRRSWRDQPASAVLVWFLRTFCRPVFFQTLFHRWKRRKLELNPIGWLGQRSWTGRLITWIWLGLIMLLSSLALLVPVGLGDSGRVNHVMVGLLVIIVALGAAASFRQERENGVLELLLVSPLAERKILSGRLRGLWTQFLPGATLLIGIWVFVYCLYQTDGDRPELGLILFSASSFLIVPVVGLHFSLVCRSFPAAFLGTMVNSILLPMSLATLSSGVWWLYFGWSGGSDSWQAAFYAGAAGWQAIIAFFSWRRLCRRLRERAFASKFA